MKNCPVALVLLASSFFFCQLSNGNEEEVFLDTDYKPLAHWLDENYSIDYRSVPLAIIFDEVPLGDIFYETSHLPASTPGFTLKREKISRRELLRLIAEYWNLEMSLAPDANGNPRAVVVRGQVTNEI